MSTPRATIAEIRDILNRLLDKIEADGTESISLGETFYWDVPEESRYEMGTPPADFDIRSLHDDWDCIRFALDEGEEPIVDQLIELAPILRYLGDRLRRDPE